MNWYKKAQSNNYPTWLANEITRLTDNYTKGMPDPDLVIRTSGEMRLSNFLIWQAAYAEIVVTETLWPDFDKAQYVKTLQDYQSRDRRFGGAGD